MFGLNCDKLDRSGLIGEDLGLSYDQSMGGGSLWFEIT